MTIEQLEALEKAATAGPWAVDGTSKQVKIVHPVSPVDGCVANRSVVCRAMLSGPRHMKYARANMEMCAATRNALPALLAVAKAAKCYTNADPMVRGEAYRDLCEALSRLEAQ